MEAKDPAVEDALARLGELWPRGLRVASLFPDVAHVVDDLRLLHANQLIDLRLAEPAHVVAGDALPGSKRRRAATTRRRITRARQRTRHDVAGHHPTPYAVGHAWSRDRDGAHEWIVAVKAMYRIAHDGSLALAPEQDEPLIAPI